ncbi:hypothetical protein GCM10023193_46450 [Planotetraspora kaengkrachanensis]|uniref:2'-5' RNA ligase family protein n=2 Tax=Planotetraspora kaengkrachanensis TaxID=575193 RepID=A0A8J3LXX0_9ACTN|nr:hypothetical protein Pka01_37140 [Planotetraspora kaengkrachanensis]
MQGIGFTDAIADEALGKIEHVLRSELRQVPPPVVTFHRPVIVPEAIYLPAQPAAAIQNLRTTCRTAIASVHPIDPESLPYRPHVSVAYVNADSPTEHIAQAST